MNWNYWLPWRDYPQDGNEDLSYEEEVIERCDHDFEQTTEQLGPDFVSSTIEDGYLVVPVKEVVKEFCEKCGEPGYKGETDDYITDTHYTGKWSRVSHHLVFKPEFRKEPDLSVSAALTEPEECGGENRVLVNQSDMTGALFTVTD